MLRKNRVLIDLDALRNNYRLVKEHIPSTADVMCVVKADAYGHGMVECARALFEAGARHFAVAIADEGVWLRQAGIEGDILVLGAATPRAAAEAIRYSLSQTVFTPDMITLLNQEAERQNSTALVHIKLDTGMNRIGLRTCEEAQAVAQALRDAPHVRAAGIYTHFADADTPDEAGEINRYSRAQMERFAQLRACFDPSIPVHAANSAATLLAPDAHFSMVRDGISIYGYPPVPSGLPFRHALSWLTEVVHVKELKAGEYIGYGCTFTAERDMKVATVAVGYGDGYHRALSNRGWMIIRGVRVPIVGRVCMDQTMVDVTQVPGVSVGDDVVLIGSEGGERIDAEEVAVWADTISYEVLLTVAQRVPRVYVGQ